MIKTGKASRAIFMLVIFIMTLLIGFVVMRISIRWGHLGGLDLQRLDPFEYDGVAVFAQGDCVECWTCIRL